MSQQDVQYSDEASIKAMLARLPKVEARDYQFRLISKTLHYLYDRDYGSLMLESPTGSGKTITALITLALIQQRDPSCGIGWMVHRRNLLNQVAAEVKKYEIPVTLAPISMFEHSPPTQDKDGRKIKFMLGDEVHHDACSSASSIYNAVNPAKILGLTGTPFRTDKMRLCFEKIIRDIGVHQLIKGGYLSEFHHYVIPNWEVDTVVAAYLREPERWGKSVFYWHDRSDAEKCTQMLREAGHKVEFILGEQPVSHREDILDAFDEGKLDAIVNMQLLTEGWDCPSLETAWVRPSSKLPTIQMCGRPLRKYPGLPHKNIIQSKDSRYTYLKTATPSMGYQWCVEQNEWRSLKPNPHVDRIAMDALLAAARASEPLPKFLLEKRKLEVGHRQVAERFSPITAGQSMPERRY